MKTFALGVAALALLVLVGAASGATGIEARFHLFGEGEVEMCFAGIGYDPFLDEGPPVPVTVTVAHAYKRAGTQRRTSRTFRFLVGSDVVKETEQYELVSDVLGCVTLRMKGPLVAFKNATQKGTLLLGVNSQRDGPAGAARYAYTMRVLAAEQIFQGTDAFINYCINELKEIRSSGGRLYCWTEGATIVTMRRLSY